MAAKASACSRPRSSCWSRSGRCWRWACRSSPPCSAWHRHEPHRLDRQRLEVPDFAPLVAIDDRHRRRHRLRPVHRHAVPHGLRNGDEPEAAVRVAIATAGRAVMFAGTVVDLTARVVADGLRRSSRRGHLGIAAVLVTMFASVTLLPALWASRDTPSTGSGPFRRHTRRATGAVIVALEPDRAAPPVARRVLGAAACIVSARRCSACAGFADPGNNPEEFTSRRAYDLLADGFGPGFNGPILVVVGRRRAGVPADAVAARRCVHATEGVASQPPVVEKRAATWRSSR